MKNKTSISKLCFLIASILSFFFTLFLFIKSFEKYDDGYGISYGFNETYLIALIVSISFSIFYFISLIKNKNNLKKENHLLILSNLCLISFYTLGQFFKTMFKALSKNKPFIFMDNYAYLFIGLVTLGIALGYLFKTIDDFKQK